MEQRFSQNADDSSPSGPRGISVAHIGLGIALDGQDQRICSCICSIGAFAVNSCSEQTQSRYFMQVWFTTSVLKLL